MDDTQTIGSGPAASDPTAPEGVAHSHAEAYDESTFAIARVKHPVTGEDHAFTYPVDCKDPKIRFEFPDSTLGEFDNPHGEKPVDPENDDVVWDGAAGQWIPRVTSAEAGASGDVAGG